MSDPVVAAAYHEAGHAVVGGAVGMVVSEVWITPDANQAEATGSGGRCRFAEHPRPADARPWLRAEAVTDYAGALAEVKHWGSYNPELSKADHQFAWLRAEEMAEIVHRDRGAAVLYVHEWRAEAQRVLDAAAGWAAVEALAAALLEHHRLDGDAVRRIVDEARARTEEHP